MNTKTYLIYDGRYYKIGISSNPKKRLKQIKGSNPDAVLISYTNKNIEEYLHKKFNQYHYSGEWFEIKYTWDLIDLLFYFDNNFYILYCDDKSDEWKRISDDKKYSEIIKLERQISTTKNKQSSGAKKSNNTRRKDTIDKINETYYKFIQNDINPTQKMICNETGLSIATVKRNWKIKNPFEIYEK